MVRPLPFQYGPAPAGHTIDLGIELVDNGHENELNGRHHATVASKKVSVVIAVMERSALTNR